MAAVDNILAHRVQQLHGAVRVAAQLVVKEDQLAVALPLGNAQGIGGTGNDRELTAREFFHENGAAGDAEGDRSPLHCQGYAGQPALDLIQFPDALRRGLPEAQGKLGTVHPVDRAAALLRLLLHRLGQGVQHLVAEHIVVDIVDGMEVVDADHQQHSGRSGGLDGLDGVVELIDVIEIGNGIHGVDDAVIGQRAHEEVRLAVRALLNDAIASADDIIAVLVAGPVFQTVALLPAGE